VAVPITGIPRPARVRPVPLPELAAVAGVPAPDSTVAVTGITLSDARVRTGDLFAGVPGRSAHGASYAAAAVAAGAVAVLTDAVGRAHVPDGVPVLEVPDVRAVLGRVSAAVYGNPADGLQILGVTGTSGKTTTAYFLRAGLQAAGIPSGLIGTVATMIGDDEIRTGFTTPEATDVQALLAAMVEHGVQAVAAEVSSHALLLGRADGIEFAVGAFTNLSQDHLDLHGSMEEYFLAKAKLFDGRSRAAVIVVDDDWGRRMAAVAGPSAVTVSTDGSHATWRALDVVSAADGHTTFRVVGPDVSLETACGVPGRYNVANALLALAILAAAGVDPVVAAPAIAAAAVPGRMETVRVGQQFLAVVDYSHKPAAVQGALAALRPLTPGRLIVVLGCGGDRDAVKRPLMGEIAARDADLLVVTDDNPRSEDPAAIRAAMMDGARRIPNADVREVGDRAAAIAAAVAAAVPGDTVLVAGKGHETGQEIMGVVTPFDDRDVLADAIRASLS
jgi:UDP-N-acetylmuramoyl-L-alanyl-D-glutamate--2,6-diaminopimelate ligase